MGKRALDQQIVPVKETPSGASAKKCKGNFTCVFCKKSCQAGVPMSLNNLVMDAALTHVVCS